MSSNHDNASPRGQGLVHFEEMLGALRQRGCIPPEELELITEMRHEGSINTLWLKKNYHPEETNQEFEIVEEFKPLVFGPYHALYAIAEGSSGIVYKGWEKIGRAHV